MGKHMLDGNRLCPQGSLVPFGLWYREGLDIAVGLGFFLTFRPSKQSNPRNHSFGYFTINAPPSSSMFTATNRLFVLGGFQSLKMDSFAIYSMGHLYQPRQLNLRLLRTRCCWRGVPLQAALYRKPASDFTAVQPCCDPLTKMSRLGMLTMVRGRQTLGHCL